jgi:prepilin-type N-terminal cleavage/methylation domain-containing protein
VKRQTGFTLVELVIVIAVLGILAGLAIPYFMEAREEAAKKECLANRTQIMRMFHAQQASNYNGTLVGFLAEVVKEPNDNKYFNFVPKCADNGTYSVSNEIVVCSIAEHNEANGSGDASVIDNITNDFQEFLDKYGAMTDQQLKDLVWWPTYASGVLVKTNDGFREAYYKEKGKWPSGVDLNGNTIYFKFHLTADGSFLTYANGNGDFKNSGDWGTNYIYDSAAKKWYYSPQGTNLGGISNSVDKGGKTEAQIIDKIKNEGWEEVTLTGNTFSK